METAFADDLRRHLLKLFGKSLTEKQFRQWFSKAWCAAESSSPDDLFDFATRIEHLTYILDAGVWDEEEFRRRLLKEATSYFGPIIIAADDAVGDTLEIRSTTPWSTKPHSAVSISLIRSRMFITPIPVAP